MQLETDQELQKKPQTDKQTNKPECCYQLALTAASICPHCANCFFVQSGATGGADGETCDELTMDTIRISTAKASPSTSGRSSPMPEAPSGISSKRMLSKEPSELVKDGLNSVPMDNDFALDEMEKMNSVLPTMWLGSQSGR